MERGKGEASRTVQGFDRNVSVSRQRLSNNYEERIYPMGGNRTRYEHAQVPDVVTVVLKREEELQDSVAEVVVQL